MPSPSTLAYWEGLILIVGLFGVVFWKLANGKIALDDLFEGDIREKNGDYSSYTSKGRVQSFLVTIYVALYYLLQIIHNPHQFPEVPTAMVAALAGSHALYLGGKAQTMLLGRFRDFLK